MSLSRRSIVVGSAAALAAAFGGGYAIGSYNAAMAAAIARIARKSSLVTTRFGPLEYAIEGRGQPLLMVHGTGGGFDQGLRFGGGLIASGFQVIAPSRFGYLRSFFPADPSPQNQADAFAALLDHLGIDRIPIAGGSAGALPAAWFALRHPDRCSHLILLVPAMNLSNRDPVEFTRFQQVLVGRLLSSDRWFWAVRTLAPNQLIGTLLATDPALLASVSASERDRAYMVLDELAPIRRRRQGMAQDGRMAGSPADIDLSRIETPALVVSTEDDRFGTAQTARIIAGRIAGARLVIYPTGGHLWLGHDQELTAEIAGFVARPLG
ncbi:alpha/beta hydrolase [Hoeflea sp.]|uniref:alpha/beta fold hydrolase n=1 Tax=Hoeflea sp. TaxID=1940281 RepID=UPI0019A02403|nr:alpha/beta hydrolase [Hoeflea sp.]MBC7280950.1 alpha/beta hydrolase [Hoeflea sp.]